MTPKLAAFVVLSVAYLVAAIVLNRWLDQSAAVVLTRLELVDEPAEEHG